MDDIEEFPDAHDYRLRSFRDDTFNPFKDTYQNWSPPGSDHTGICRGRGVIIPRFQPWKNRRKRPDGSEPGADT